MIHHFARAASIALLLGVAHSALAAVPSSEPGAAALFALPQGNVRWADGRNDVGQVEPDLELTQLSVLLKRPAGRQAAFEELLREQQDPSSPNFHHWLTASEVGERFGAAQADIDAVKSWLSSQGLHVEDVSNSRVRIHFSGSAANVGAAFGAEMHGYAVNGEKRVSISDAPRIPASLVGIVRAVQGLESVNEKSHAYQGKVRSSPATPKEDHPDLTNCSTTPCINYITPKDFATIYGLNPVYLQNITGKGETIAIIGRSRVLTADIENFQTRTGLAVKDPTVIVPPKGIDPGPANDADTGGDTPADQFEATLDVTRATSVAPDATIELVISKSAPTGSGIYVASEYVVDTPGDPAYIMSISFGDCETNGGSTGVLSWDELFAQAAAEGVSVFVSSGDSGAAGCSDAFKPPPGSQHASPSYICASSYATCVGGTQFIDGASQGFYWRTPNGSGFSSAFTYIPEGAWNEPLDDSGAVRVAATGGGVSAFIATPSWQTGPGIPGTAGRYTPDVSFSASLHDDYFICLAASGGSCVTESGGSFHFETGAGTSAATPSMAGIAALLNQNMGEHQGNLNPRLYALAATPGNGVFHDITVATSGVAGCSATIPSVCNNSTPGPLGLNGGLQGFLVGNGYDLATGLGSLDVASLLAKWKLAASTANYQGLWWASPAGSESGWGINFAHQGDTIFATWFTYDLTGAGNWLVMTAPKTAANTYSGTLYATIGPAFNAVPFNPSAVTAQAEGTGTLTFTDSSNGTFTYSVAGSSQAKSITREVFGTLPSCATAASAASLASATNYTDLWWASPASSESGWGINLTHEGTTIFGSWFTYDANGKAMWLVVTATQTTPNSYAGTLYRTTGPAFNTVPFNPTNVVATAVGNATFTFSDGNTATFAYTVNGISQTKGIMREIFSGNGTVCQ